MPQERDPVQAARDAMVDKQLRARGIHDGRVLEAMRELPRHEFVPPSLRLQAYADSALPIGSEQTISQPYVVALMTQYLRLRGYERVLEIGTGSGYQTAVLCRLARIVYTLERHAELAGQAAEILARIGCDNVEIHIGDGSQGLPDMAPFDAILVTAAAPSIPGPLRTQLSSRGGRLVIPVGSERTQHIAYVERMGDHWQVTRKGPVRFVPLLGRYGFEPPTREDEPPADGED